MISKMQISRNDVSNAPNMKGALQEFVNWLPNDVKVVSWSENDELQIRHEVEAKNICIEGLEDILDRWIDCQEIFGEEVNSPKCNF